jgi:putative endonuclease
VDRGKQNKLRKAAELYLSRYEGALQPRFDVAEIYAPDGTKTQKPVVYYLENAF